jgi:signal transduction histidine kinase
VRLRAGQWFALSVGLMVVVAVVGTVASVVALSRLSDARVQLADRLDPTAIAAAQLKGALVDQETGIRGYALGGDRVFLAPYNRGRRDAADAAAQLRALSELQGVQQLRDEVETVLARAREWQTGYAQPTLAQLDGARSPGSVASGKRRFDAFRLALADLEGKLSAARRSSRDRLDLSATEVQWLVIGTGVVVLLTVLGAARVLRGTIVQPLARLAGGVRAVAQGGDFERPVEGSGALEVVGLGQDVDAMRGRIVAELESLRVTQRDLERSNSELEQFAYVASHDLQEPLRKVASFCQLLQQRYGGRLDERADQYIGFAVDGARRMEELINAILAFSRVGRVEQPFAEVDCNELVLRARADLTAPIKESGAEVHAGALPTVLGDGPLLRLVFQNLIGNAVKFRGEVAPVVHVDAERDGDRWRFSVSDNGIGIESEYADRIFIIFQRLHPRASYEGTGIGLAMCRKIVEYHGGEIWLDTEDRSGSTFCFTLPADT